MGENATARVAKAPCAECPFRRTSARGWLGSGSIDDAEPYLRHALGDHDISCHMVTANSCAGLAIFRRNIAKMPREPGAAAATLSVRADRDTVFARPDEFLDHHTIRGTLRPRHEVGDAGSDQPEPVARLRPRGSSGIPDLGDRATLAPAHDRPSTGGPGDLRRMVEEGRAAAAEIGTAKALAQAVDAILMRPPEPVSHPSQEWCDAYAEWHDAYVVARRRVMGQEGER